MNKVSTRASLPGSSSRTLRYHFKYVLKQYLPINFSWARRYSTLHSPSGQTAGSCCLRAGSEVFPAHSRIVTPRHFKAKNHKYTALSYTWGERRNLRIIRCNGCPVSVTRNLYSALFHLRDEQSPRVFWTDALYIDQTNIDERNRQMQQIREFYSRSAQTVIWLGEGSLYPLQGFEAAACLAQRLHSLGDPPRSATSHFRWIWGNINFIKLCIYCASFMLLLRISYFSHIRVMQEITLG